MIKFTIPGQPVGYTRQTYWQARIGNLPHVKRYRAWKEFVRICSLQVKFNRNPIDKIRLDVMIYFKNKKHPDPENVRKGIQDALFENDKYVIGCYDFDYDKDDPRCEVEINMANNL